MLSFGRVLGGGGGLLGVACAGTMRCFISKFLFRPFPSDFEVYGTIKIVNLTTSLQNATRIY